MSRVKLFPSLAASLVLVAAALLLTGSTTVRASQPSLSASPSQSASGTGGVRGTRRAQQQLREKGAWPMGIRNAPAAGGDALASASSASLAAVTNARAASSEASLNLAQPAMAAGTDAYSPIGGPLRDVLATSQDWSLRPHNETSIAINPTNPLNIIVGMNDYHLGFGMSGYAVSQDGGLTWVKGLAPMATLPITTSGRLVNNGRVPDGGGDPVIAFDREGRAYYAQLHFTREDFYGPTLQAGEGDNDSGGVKGDDDDAAEQSPIGRNGIVVVRSDNGGRTWRQPQFSNPRPSPGSTVPPNGIVTYEADPATGILNDKEWMAVDQTTGPYSGRIYVVWTQYQYDKDNDYEFMGQPIMLSYSSDHGDTWSTPKKITGSSELCDYDYDGTAPRRSIPCDDDQGVYVVVGPDGTVYVSFENFDTADENQMLMVRSRDGGQTWQGPWKIDDVYDSLGYYQTVNGVTCPYNSYGRATMPNSCFRVNSFGSLAVDPVNGDLYQVWSDNRNGVRGVPKPNWRSSRYATESRFNPEPVMDTDVFISKSTDGGQTWSQALRVNQDQFHNRKQQWFPSVAVSENGMVVVAYYDRREDAGDKMSNRYMSVAMRPSLAFSDVKLSSQASNFDYSFRGGLFMGDYDQIVVRGNYVYGSWTDSRFAAPDARFSDVFISTRFANVGSAGPGGR